MSFWQPMNTLKRPLVYKLLLRENQLVISTFLKLSMTMKNVIGKGKRKQMLIIFQQKYMF